MAAKLKSGEAIGPAQGGAGNPVNPSEQIFLGSPLPILQPQSLTGRRAFSLQTKNPLHYDEGPGTDETVTSRRPAVLPLLGELDSDHTDYLSHDFGEDPNKYSSGQNDSTTTNGVEIRGT